MPFLPPPMIHMATSGNWTQAHCSHQTNYFLISRISKLLSAEIIIWTSYLFKKIHKRHPGLFFFQNTVYGVLLTCILFDRLYDSLQFKSTVHRFSIFVANLFGFFSFPAPDDDFLFDFDFDNLSSHASSAYIKHMYLGRQRLTYLTHVPHKTHRHDSSTISP